MFSLGDLIFIYRACIATNNLETLSVFCKMTDFDFDFDFDIQHHQNNNTGPNIAFFNLYVKYNEDYSICIKGDFVYVRFFGAFPGFKGVQMKGHFLFHVVRRYM